MNPLSAAAWVAAFFLCANLFSHTVALRLLLLLLGIGLCAWAVLKDRSSLKALPPIWIAFALWAAWAALSVVWSEDIARSEKEFRNEILYAGAALWICYVAAQAANARRIIIPIVAGGVVLACAMAIYFFSPSQGIYVGGWHGGPGDHSSALLTIAPCLLAFSLQAPRGRLFRLGSFALGSLIIASAYTTFNRTIWLGFAVQLIAISALTLSSRWPSMTGRAKLLAVSAALVLTAGSAVMTAVVHFEREAVHAAFPIKQDPRLALWPEVVELVEARMVTGYGFGRGLMRSTLRTETGDVLLWHSHNLFLDLALQTGLPGLGLFLLLLGSIVRAGWLATRRRAEFASACGIALIAIVAGMLVRNMTDVLWVRQNALLFWGVVGVLLAWSSKSPTETG